MSLKRTILGIYSHLESIGKIFIPRTGNNAIRNPITVDVKCESLHWFIIIFVSSYNLPNNRWNRENFVQECASLGSGSLSHMLVSKKTPF